MVNSDQLSLFTVITGPRGSHKTLLMTAVACDRLLRSFYLKQMRNIEQHVWTNLPIGFKHKSEIDGKIYKLQSEPLNMEAFYTFDKGLSSGWVFIDEIDQWYDRQDWAATTQKLLNSVITQIRKRKLSLCSTIQNFNWLNARAQFQTDITVGCREAAFSPWGRKMRLGLGEVSFLQWKDISGVMTGYQYEETQRYYTTNFSGKRFWNCYDTDFQFDPTQTKQRYSLKQSKKVIEVGADGYRVRGNQDDGMGLFHSEPKDRNQVLIADLVDELIEKGTQEMPRGEFWRMARERGFDNTPASVSVVGMLLPTMGVERDGNTLIFNQGIRISSPPTKVPPRSPNNNSDEPQPLVSSPSRQYTHSRAFKKKQLVKAGKK